MSHKFKGTGVALATPFNEDLSIDFNGLKNLIEHVKDHVDYLVVGGTTAESATMTFEERQSVLSFIVNNNKYHRPIVFGVGSNDSQDVKNQLLSFDLTGVEAILSVCPYYLKPSQEGIIAHYEFLAKHSPLPIILYNVPGRTSVNMNAETTVHLSKIENIIGVKEASGDLVQIMKVIRDAEDDFLVISGDDMLTQSIIGLGGDGVISVMANAKPKEFSSMVNNALNQDSQASANLALMMLEYNELLFVEGNPVGVKLALELEGVCQSYVRLPLVKGSAELKYKLDSLLG